MRYIDDIIEDLNPYLNKFPYTKMDIHKIHNLSIELKAKCENLIEGYKKE